MNSDCFIHIINQVSDPLTLARLIKVNKLFKDITVKRFNGLYSRRALLSEEHFEIVWTSRICKSNDIFVSYKRCYINHKDIKIPYYRISDCKFCDNNVTYQNVELQNVTKEYKPRLVIVKHHDASSSQIYLIDGNIIKSRIKDDIKYLYDKGGRLIQYYSNVKDDGTRHIVYPFNGNVMYSFNVFQTFITVNKVSFEIYDYKLQSFRTFNSSVWVPNHHGGSNYAFKCFCDKCIKNNEGEKLLFLITSHRMFWPVVDMVPEEQKKLFGCHVRRKTHCYYCQKRLGESYVKAQDERWHSRCWNKVK